MKRWMMVSLLCVGALLCLAGLAALLLPGILKSLVVQRVEAATSRELTIGEVSLNPFTWTVEVRDLRFSELHGKETFLAFSSARVAVSPMSLFRRAPVLASARLASPKLRIVRNGANSYNFTDLLKWLPLHPRLSVSNLSVSNGSLDFTDRGLAVAKRHELRRIELAVPFVTTMRHPPQRHYVTPRLSALLNGSPLRLEGRLRPFPRAAEILVSLELRDVALSDYLAYLPKEFPVRVDSGRLSARVDLSYLAAHKRDPELTLSGEVTLAELKLAHRSGAPFLALRRLDARIARARPLTGEFDFSSLSADALEVFLSRDRKGSWSHSQLARSPAPDRAAPRKIRASVTKARLRNGRLHFVDHLPAGGFSTDLAGISLDLAHYSTAPGTRASFALSFATERGERGSLKGEFSPVPLTLSALVELTGVPLADFGPYLPGGLRMTIAGGRLDGRIAVSLSGRGGRLAGSFAGSAGIRKLHCLDAGGMEFLKWHSLELDRIRGSLHPWALDIGAVTLTRFHSRINVAKDGRLNLAQLNARPPAQDGRKPAAAGGRNPIRIGTFALRDGTLAFTDQHVTGGYATTLFGLGGRISGLSSQANSFAEVELRGDLEHESPLRITGRINPLRNDLYADLKVSFTGIELPPMTPYSGTYLGYAVDRGTLHLHSGYRLDKGRLDWSNSLFIDQLYLGRSMESDRKTALPVHLALALLKDRNGEIHLELPVGGKTDDPGFGVRHQLLGLWKKLVLAAQESPFALLGTVFGEKEDLSGVSFAYGSAELAPEEQAKLSRLATVLNDRPALHLAVAGLAAGEREGALGEEQLQNLARARAVEVRRFLVDKGKVAGARVLLKGSGPSPAPGRGRGSGSRVELEIGVE